MKKKTIIAMPDDLAQAHEAIGRVRATLSHLLDDSDAVKGKTWKYLNKVYQALDQADRELRAAQTRLEETLPKLLKQWDKKK
ncbi:MAG TPA: hypothetical protein EYP25_13860 [Anaerolineae bacterium]|nr:hypothetical protein [Anaerolineae bacterium]HIQ12532.1 hypothetical protein [Caldilineales bacterium]